MNSRTIAAISTPIGPGGIGIIRISGSEAKTVLRNIFIPANPDINTHCPNTYPIHSHRIYYGHIVDPDTSEIIDESLVFCMEGPRSFTREDVVEIQSHSGFVVLEQIMGLLMRKGVQLAEAGEFTKRAFLNGRIDLGQAEAVIDKINASSVTASIIASNQMTGAVSTAIRSLMDRLISLQARCEVLLEFSEADNGEPSDNIDNITSNLRKDILPSINSLIKNHKDTAIYKKGINITIAGIPNAGKSSLLNQLTCRETAIVSEYPGTTRDVIKDYISINGIPITLSDTAGIHHTDDPIERLGIEKAKGQIESADLVLLVVEGNRPLNEYEIEWIRKEATATIVVINKMDIADPKKSENIQKSIGDRTGVIVSAKTGKGIEQLKSVIFDFLMIKDSGATNHSVIPNARQSNLLERVKIEIAEILDLAKQDGQEEIISLKIGNILRFLGDIIGVSAVPDIYDEIFNRFCIGK